MKHQFKIVVRVEEGEIPTPHLIAKLLSEYAIDSTLNKEHNPGSGLIRKDYGTLKWKYMGKIDG